MSEGEGYGIGRSLSVAETRVGEMALSRTDLMIIRAWVEPGPERLLQAHIRLTTDMNAGSPREFTKEFTVGEPGTVSKSVQEWLTSILTESASS